MPTTSFWNKHSRVSSWVQTKGRPITSTTKDTLYPEDLAGIVGADVSHFTGINGEPQRQRLVEHWLSTDLATGIKAGMGHAGRERIANLKPIHMSTIKLLDPRIRSQDRDLSVFLYNVFRETDLVIGESSMLLPYLTKGTVPFGDHDLKLSEAQAGNLDVETLFLLRLLENFKTDLPDNRSKDSSSHFSLPSATTASHQRYGTPAGLQRRYPAPGVDPISRYALLISRCFVLSALFFSDP
jgi:hypothetical protein